MEIRKATVDDLDLIMEIRIQMVRDLHSLLPSESLGESFMKNTERYFKSSEQTTILAIDNSKVIGCATICYISILPSLQHPEGKRAHIMNVYVNEVYRSQGIACRMMDLLMTEAKKNGVSEISLDTTELGRSLYEKCGFTSTNDSMVIRL